MAILQKHMKSLRGEVQKYFNQYQAAKADMEKAENIYRTASNDANVFSGKNPRALLEVARMNALTETRRVEMEQARQAFQTVRKARFAVLDKAKKIRQELETDVQAAFLADPEQVDNNVLRLIDSGILKAADYEKLFNDAQAAGNTTMCRLIAAAAGNLAKTAEGNDRVALNMLTHRAESLDGNGNLNADLRVFDETIFSLSLGIGDVETGRTENMDTVAYWLDSTADGEQDT